MPNPVTVILAVAGSLLLVAAGVVPVLLWPTDAVGGAARQQLALTAGGCCLVAGLGCWIGAAMARKGIDD